MSWTDCGSCGHPVDPDQAQLCEDGGLCVPVDLVAWCAQVDELVDQGVDPFLAIVEADPRSDHADAAH